MEFSGRCLCGAIGYRATGPPLSVTHCHCSMCRRSTGAAFATWVGFRRERVSFEDRVPALFASSSAAERGFCPTCGSTLTMAYLKTPFLLDIAAGTLDRPDLVVPTGHIWTEDSVQWAVLGDELPRHVQGPASPVVEVKHGR